MFSTKLTFDPYVKALSLIAALLYVYPFATADIYYADDIVRTISGGFGWTELGRPLSNLIFYIIGFSSGKIVDISPLPQIAAVMLLTLSAWYFSSSVYGKVSLAGVVFSSPLLLNPFFLQNLAYKYDSITMAAAIFITTMAFVIQKDNFRTHVLSAALLVASLCLYQPVVNVFIGMIAVAMLRDVATHGRVVRGFLTRSAVFCFSYAFYTFVVAPIFSTTSRSELAIGDGAARYISLNIASLAENIESLLNRGALYSYAPLLLAAILGVALLIFKGGVKNSFFIFVSLIVAMVSLCGPLFLLKNFGFVPRVMVGFTGFMLYVFYAASLLCESKKTNNIVLALGVYNIMLCFSICYSFINAQKSQIDYEDHVLESIASHIFSDRSLGTSVVMGSFGESAYNKTQQSTFPIISKLALTSYDWTNYMRLKNMGVSTISFRYNRSEMQRWLNEACRKGSSPISAAGDYSLLKSQGRSFFFVGDMKGYRCK
ncbi:glucosyltransferase domain-containing protein [Cronobacter turicensis]